MITAEVIPVAQKTAQAAKALQHAGFRVLSIGQTITIGGEKELFERFFEIRLLKLAKAVLRGLPKPVETEFHKPERPPVIPKEFQSLIRSVVFPEPPEYFG